jgi:hypothetical protein
MLLRANDMRYDATCLFLFKKGAEMHCLECIHTRTHGCLFVQYA